MRKLLTVQHSGVVASTQLRNKRRRKLDVSTSPDETQPQQPPTTSDIPQNSVINPTGGGTLHNIRGQIDAMRVSEQKQRFASEMKKMAKQQRQGGSDQAKEFLFGPQKPTYARGLLERNEQLQMQLLSKATQDDMEDVLRKDAPKFAKVLKALDPATQRSRLERGSELHNQLHTSGTEDTAMLDKLENMSDEELLEAMKAGVVDPFSFEEDLDDLEGNLEKEEVGTASASNESSELPAEFFDNAHAMQLTNALTEQLRPGAVIEDDVAPVLAKVQANNSYKDFTQRDLELLETYEQRKAAPLGDRRNAVLNYVASIDEPLRRSLEVMERTKLSASVDSEFQDAMKYTRTLEARDRSFVKATARFRPGAADTPLFFGSGIAKAPKRAQLDLPEMRADKYRKTYGSKIVHDRTSRKRSAVGRVKERLFHK